MAESRPVVQGFTFIELLLVLAIMAITLQTGLASFQTQLTAMRSQSALREIRTLFALARQEALLSRRAITVCAVDRDGRCQRNWQDDHAITVFVDSDRNRRVGSDERVLRELRWPLEGGDLSWRASLARPYIEFQPTGGTWQNGTLYYCPDNRDARAARALVLSHSGRSYLPTDSNGDGIREDRRGRNLSC